ncbi:hypothetical protein C8A05DRAFT_19520 [Staphylotrichum tortipilum]|uniref:Uncharacterized protein n=1 Tax=Staphylotrichum tortipilum TaxID=2831512 RepID=A0AAN6MCT0_9PEZI|nr:hypothetical protein C8A05DRAFT_19520 [Staphylotrichum longicolle]
MASVGNIIYVFFEGVFIIPLSVLWFISLCTARRNNDPARTGIAWLKVTFPFWILSLLLGTISGALGIVVDDFYSPYANHYDIRKALSHIGRTATFLGMLADILLFITFVELAVGFLLCLRPDGSPSRARKPARIAIFVWAFVLFALSLACLGVGQAYIVQFYRSALQRQALAFTMIKLSSAVEILLWITSIPILVLASYIVNKTSSFQLLHNVRHLPSFPHSVAVDIPRPNPLFFFIESAVLLLVATVLDFVRLTVKMSLLIHYNLVDPIGYTPSYVFDIIYTMFDTVFMFIALVILFALAIRKYLGLWSKPQPGWSYPGPGIVYVPAMMAVPVAGPGGVVMQPQQQPQQQPLQPAQNLPAYLQVAQQKQQQEMQQQQQQQQQQYGQPQYGQPMAAPQGYYYPPQQQQPAAAPAVAPPQPAVTSA